MWADQAHGKAYFNEICFNDILLKTVFTIKYYLNTAEYLLIIIALIPSCFTALMRTRNHL